MHSSQRSLPSMCGQRQTTAACTAPVHSPAISMCHPARLPAISVAVCTIVPQQSRCRCALQQPISVAAASTTASQQNQARAQAMVLKARPWGRVTPRVSAKIVAKFTLDCQVSLQSATGTPSSQKSHDFAVQEPFAAQELRTSGAGPGASIAMRCRGGWAGGGEQRVDLRTPGGP